LLYKRTYSKFDFCEICCIPLLVYRFKKKRLLIWEQVGTGSKF
jgi:hypothetical protein